MNAQIYHLHSDANFDRIAHLRATGLCDNAPEPESTQYDGNRSALMLGIYFRIVLVLLAAGIVFAGVWMMGGV